MKKRALLIIDMLNDFVLRGAALEVPDTRIVAPRIRRRLVHARRSGVPVFYICDSHREDDPEFSRMNWPPHAVRGSRGAMVIDELAPQPGDRIIAKTAYSGFYRTELEDVLRSQGVEEMILTGCVTNICVLYTAADAVMRGFGVVVPADSVAAISREGHEFALREMEQVLGVRVERQGFFRT